MTQRLIPALIIALSVVFPPAASAQDQHQHDEGDDHAHEAEPGDSRDSHDDADHEWIRLSPAELEEFGIEVEEAGPGVIETHIELPGEVRPNADRLAHIVPRFSGIVTDVRAGIGDYVQEGQVLAVVESNESLAPFEVTTLISGTVISKHITLGEAASRDRDTFVIADLSTVWVDLTVYQRDIGRVKAGQQAQVYVGHALAHDTGVISYVTPILDEHTRTATARLVLQNKDNHWRPGMFVTARVLLETTEVPLVVPRSALYTVGEDTVVFLEAEQGFRPQPVSLGRSGETHVEILSGLSEGDAYVSEGGFTLKAELGKEAFGDGHAH